MGSSGSVIYTCFLYQNVQKKRKIETKLLQYYKRLQSTPMYTDVYNIHVPLPSYSYLYSTDQNNVE